jgi:hypothetical protein
MSKLGRYSADRKKVETLAATKTITVADCGTLFICTTHNITGTLPDAATAGAGWWAKFIIGASAAGTLTITGSATDAPTRNIFLLRNSKTEALVNLGLLVGQASPDGGATGGIRIDLSGGKVGDQVELVCDGTNYYATSFTSSSVAIGPAIPAGLI